MKKFLLSLATVFSFVLFLGSCTNEEDINNNGYSDKEKAKIETLMNSILMVGNLTRLLV